MADALAPIVPLLCMINKHKHEHAAAPMAAAQMALLLPELSGSVPKIDSSRWCCCHRMVLVVVVVSSPK